MLVAARGDTTSDSPGEGAGRRWIRGAAAVAPHARGRPWVRHRQLDEWWRVGGPTVEPHHRNGFGQGRPWRA
jgi:hypothetical protein